MYTIRLWWSSWGPQLFWFGGEELAPGPLLRGGGPVLPRVSASIVSNDSQHVNKQF